MKVINLLGGPGAGKSTTAFGLAYKMKLHHMKVELVTEYAKELVYDGTLEMMLDRQEVIFAEQNQRLHRLRNKVDYAIVDSPLFLSYIYPEMNQEQKGVTGWPAIKEFQALVLAVINTYDNVNIFLKRPGVFEEGGREHDLEQSKEIDDRIMVKLDALEVPFQVFYANGVVVDNIMERIILPND